MIDIKASLNGKGEVTVGGAFADLATHLDRGKREMMSILKNQIEMYLEEIATAMEAKHSGPYKGGTTPDSLSKRSGEGIASIRKSISITGNSINNVVGKMGGVFYLGVQEEGGTLTPKSAQYLTVPLDAALDANGVPKRLSVREWDNTFVGTSRDGSKKIVYLRLLDHKVLPLYLLVSKVSIVPRLGMKKEAENRLTDLTTKLSAAIVAAIGEPQ
jgi:hypothetical protein